MTVVSFPQPNMHSETPLVLFLDLQVEYIAAGRAYSLSDTQSCLANCKRILESVRSKKLAIAHFRQLKQSTFFNKETSFASWIEDFRPRPNEMLFERSRPSCYSNANFASFLQHIKAPELIIVGLAGESSCLATALEASNRDHTATYIFDASASHALGGRTEAQSHEAVSDIIGLYANLSTTDEFLARIEDVGFQAGALL